MSGAANRAIWRIHLVDTGPEGVPRTDLADFRRPAGPTPSSGGLISVRVIAQL
jgi:hypothetical protein